MEVGLFLVIDKVRGRVVYKHGDKAVAIQYALKYSDLGGTQYVLAEALGETKQVTTSVFTETKDVQLGLLTEEVHHVGGIPISELRERASKSAEAGTTGAVLVTSAINRSERSAVLPGFGAEVGQLGSVGNFERHADRAAETDFPGRDESCPTGLAERLQVAERLGSTGG